MLVELCRSGQLRPGKQLKACVLHSSHSRGRADIARWPCTVEDGLLRADRLGSRL